MKKKKYSIKEFVRRRNLAVCSMDVDVFKEWYEDMCEHNMFPRKQLPEDKIIEISMRKMACEITNIPMEVKLKAAEWLMSRGYKPGIYMGDDNE